MNLLITFKLSPIYAIKTETLFLKSISDLGLFQIFSAIYHVPPVQMALKFSFISAYE